VDVSVYTDRHTDPTYTHGDADPTYTDRHTDFSTAGEYRSDNSLLPQLCADHGGGR
jgi:hypothetical protein